MTSSCPLEPWLTGLKRNLGDSREKLLRLLGFWVRQDWQEKMLSRWHMDGN